MNKVLEKSFSKSTWMYFWQILWMCLFNWNIVYFPREILATSNRRKSSDYYLHVTLNYEYFPFTLSLPFFPLPYNCIGDVMVSVLASNAIDHGFEPWLGQTKDYKMGICCFSANHAALRRKNKDWLAQNQDNH